MNFFDGSEERLKKEGFQTPDPSKIKGSFRIGSSNLSIALVQSWVGFVILVMCFGPLLLLFSIAKLVGILHDTCVLNIIFWFFVILTLPSVILLFISGIFESKKVLKEHPILVMDDHVQVRYKNFRRGTPIQITRIPYSQIIDIHYITKEEWNKDLKMRNIFRKLLHNPDLGPSGRFHRGALKSELMTIQFPTKLDLYSYLDTNAQLAMWISLLFNLAGPNIEEEMYADDKIFISIEKDRMVEFVEMVRDLKSSY